MLKFILGNAVGVGGAKNQRNNTAIFSYLLRKREERCPSIRFLNPPPPINFVHDHLFYSKILFYFLLFHGQVRFRQFLGKVLLLGQARGPSAVARTGRGPSAAARTG